MKICTKCKLEKPLEVFKLRKDGYRNSWCQECKNENNKISPIQKQGRINYNNSINSGVYMFTCLINNKRYIGESNQPMRRRKEHLYSITHGTNISNPAMKKDMLQYGIKNFKFEVLEICSNHKEREKFWISCLKPEYNIK